ncbi:MAG: NAD(P)H-dependent oxidoreductase subunit E [Deltaproteobacteria bacterium]|nr:MAG: NAD(P)H-dependent oxidoreductase subunit E [Deltaproteobacteria bacterium]
MENTQLEKILKNYQYQDFNLLAILQDIQAIENYLPRGTLEELAKRLDLPLARIYKLATFYRAFSLTPRGRHLVTVCTGTACHVRGAALILDTLERELEIKPGETTPDREYTLETVNCLGSCALAPLLIIDSKYHGKMLGTKALSLLKGEEKDVSEGS